jgi:hypothetical protein
MIAPIDIQCPYCQAPPGSKCRTPVANQRSDVYQAVPFHHADRIDAAARHDHHRAIANEIQRMRPVYEAALDWRKHVTLAPANAYTERLIAVINKALAEETGED